MATNGCGRLQNFGHGENARCGELFGRAIWICDTCQVNALKLENAELRRKLEDYENAALEDGERDD